MKLFASRPTRRIAKFQKGSEIPLSEKDLFEIAKQYKYSHSEIMKLYHALPAEKRNKAYIELLLKMIGSKGLPMQAVLSALQS